MTQKRRHQLAVAAACVLTGASMGGSVAQESGALGGAVIGGAIGSMLPRAVAARLDPDPPTGKNDQLQQARFDVAGDGARLQKSWFNPAG